MTSFLISGLGFLFWVIAAKIYSEENVGIATALIASSNLIILLTRFGMDHSLIRFLPEGDKSKIFITSLSVTTIASIFFGFVYIFGGSIWSPNLSITDKYIPVYLVFLAANSMAGTIAVMFNACRKPEYGFIQNIFTGTRIILLPFLISLGAWGLFSSIGISMILALVISLFLIMRLNIKFKGFDKNFLHESYQYSIGNYFVGIFTAAPGQVLPLMILDAFGATETAYFYIAFSIASLLFIIPSSFSLSLLVEGSHGEMTKRNIIKALIASLIFFVPSILIIFKYGDSILMIINPNYVQALKSLEILALSGFFVSICNIYFSILRIQKNTVLLLVLSTLNFLTIIICSYVFMSTLGTEGVCYAWLTGYGFVCAIIVCKYFKDHLPLEKYIGSIDTIKNE